MCTSVTIEKCSIAAAIAMALLQCPLANAEEAAGAASADAERKGEEKSLESVVVTAPSNAADILRNVPGVLVQASGGEGNANITARGLLQSGGAKLMQFQEDGMPVLDFGDIDFGTADTFVRADYNLEGLEVIRGGSAATLASNAPGGVFNFISKTGDVKGGNLGLSRGVDFDHTALISITASRSTSAGASMSAASTAPAKGRVPSATTPNREASSRAM
jgi:outer membrane receptor protein involved in Fe transport